MSRRLLLVDFENVHQVDLSRLGDNFDVAIFVGSTQKNIPFELVTNAQRFGSRLQWKKVEGSGSNALDFFIAYELGRVFEKSPQSHCIVLSKDKGFDPLLKFLHKSGFHCRRINSLLELEPKSPSKDEPNYSRVVELLAKSDKKSRPRKLKTLAQHISSMFQKKITAADVDHIIDLLFANKLISETNNTISYDF
ncbi:MAG: PIN domain-containing protein [Methylomonas sp.]|uniref:PIN domain-containing protein n=1 Tax=Methylomonas sp. TaxID=418 RepID=UPI00260012EE|nr:PIN domain-containing protein [Methylomonas sp.]MCK9607340.1 PIN domain-containing protein [Methylomonas sp.]